MNPAEEALAETAQLFGNLLLQEIDEDRLEALHEPGLQASLGALGLEVPANDRETRDRLAAEFFDRFISPRDQNPLVQSLWQGNQYESAPAVSLRALAESAQVDFSPAAARGAPVDHLGCILLLWSELLGRWPEGARLIVTQHLDWALAPLHRHAETEGFYGQLCTLIADFIDVLSDETVPEA